MNPAASERKRKERTPEAFCVSPKCLWRRSSGLCPKHERKPVDLEEEYRRREIEEGITAHELSADQADVQSYYADKGVR